MKSLIRYTLDHCNKCLKCLHQCPTQAISIIEDRVIINNDNCIHCGKCIDQCLTRGLKETSSRLESIQQYDFTVALVPTAIFGSCKNNQEVYQLIQAILSLGFSEVEVIDKIETSCSEYVIQQAHTSEQTIISSNCPVANNLIRLRYPMLVEHLSKVDYPSEVAARYVRDKYKEKAHLGIFYLAECVGKLALAKYPLEHLNYEVDHAIALSVLFPILNKNLKPVDHHEYPLSYQALRKTMGKSLDQPGYLNVDGIEKIQHVLELEEFDLIDNIHYLNLKTCFNGCVGGNLLWGNPYNGKNNIKQLLKQAHHESIEIDERWLMRKEEENPRKSTKDFKKRLDYFTKMNQQLQQLPEYDCGACGYPSCRIMAEKILEGKHQLEDCLVLSSKKRGQYENK
ncbi:MAG: (Fe-S)-binding protein [Erysipelotrichaceae bacterium]